MTNPTITPHHREVVVKRLYSSLLTGEHVPRSSIGADTRLSGKTLGAVLADLVTRGAVLAEEDGTLGLRGPKTRYRLNKDAGRVLAFGFSYDRLGVALTDLSSAMLPNGDYLVGTEGEGWVERNPSDVLSEAARLAHKAINLTGTDPKSLVGIGLSLPGIVERTGPYKGSMTNWHSHDIAEELQRQIGLGDSLPIDIENDSNLIAMWEHRHGAARDSKHAAVVQWGAGLGAGLIIDNKMYRGPNGLAGEIGHVHTTARLEDAHPQDTGRNDPHAPSDQQTCTRCGKRCLETLIGTGALLSELEEINLHFDNIADATAAARQPGKEWDDAKDLFRRAGHLLGHKLAPIVSALNLQLVVVDAFGDPFAYPLVEGGLREGLRTWMFPDAVAQLTIRPAESGPTGSILGATDLVLDRHLGRWTERLL